jgi:predicted RNA-binding protein Jag
LKQGLTVILVGLSGYERKLVHGILAEIKGLETSSVGPQDNRKLLVMPNSQIGNYGIENAKVVDLFSA